MPDGQKQARLFLSGEAGTTAVEYGLIAMLVSVATITALWLLGDTMGELYAVDAKAVSGAIEGQE